MAGRNRIDEILLQAGVVDDLQLRSALAQQAQWGGRIAHILVERKFATEDAVVDALAQALKVQRVRPAGLPKDGGALAKLDADFCQEKGVFPVAMRDSGKTLLLAMADPTDLELVDAINHRARARISVAIAGEGEIRAAIDRHYRNREPAAQRRSFASVPADPAPERPAHSVPAPSTGPAPESTHDVLDGLLGAPATATAGFTREELEWLRSVAENQDKSGKVLRALTELLIEKGYLSAKDLGTRSKL
jgi:hypothetical protein